MNAYFSQTTAQPTAPHSRPSEADDPQRDNHLLYQAATVVAMLLLLISF